MIDTHIHLDDKSYRNDLPEVIKRAKTSGINYFINPGSDLKSNERIIKLIQEFKEIFPAFGIHPHDADKFNQSIYKNIKSYCKIYKAIAIGETGLDFHYNFSKQNIQIEVFEKHIQAAQELDLPLIIHCREAEEQVLEILTRSGSGRGVIHCFSGNWEYAQKFLDLGFYLGVTGVVTFPKAVALHEVVKKAPLERLLVETDGPYLTPIPHRGKRNESAFLNFTIDKICEIRKINRETAKEQLNKNAKICFVL